MSYAERTKVPADRSKSEIESILKKYGATSFAYGWETNGAIIMFKANNRHVKFKLPLPSTAKDNQSGEQLIRQKWRALVLAIKAKLECVESGITSFEDEFLAHIILPNGETVGQLLKPKLEDVYSSGKMPTLLLGASN